MQSKKEVKKLLAGSFRELVLKKPVEKITIKEITDGAGVIRVTFYNHFQDKYELLEWIVREETVNPFRMLLKNGMERQALVFMFNSIQHDRDFYTHAVRLEGQNSFESILRNCFSEMVTEYLLEHTSGERKKYEWLTPRRIGEFYGQALAYILITWIRSGMYETPEHMAEMYEYITSHSLMDLPKEL